jgi:hypothetical protein
MLREQLLQQSAIPQITLDTHQPVQMVWVWLQIETYNRIPLVEQSLLQYASEKPRAAGKKYMPSRRQKWPRNAIWNHQNPRAIDRAYSRTHLPILRKDIVRNTVSGRLQDDARDLLVPRRIWFLFGAAYSALPLASLADPLTSAATIGDRCVS